MVELLAILTVDKSKRVQCQADGCGKGVYKAIHVLRKQDQIFLYGSECYKKLCGEQESRPTFGSWGDTVLTEEQRQILINNTEELLQQLKEQYEGKNKVEASPLTIVDIKIPVQPSVNREKTHDYESERNLICMSCWTSFRSRIRCCPSCNKIESVVTQVLK